LIGPAAGLAGIDARRGDIVDGAPVAVAIARYQRSLPKIAICLLSTKENALSQVKLFFMRKKRCSKTEAATERFGRGRKPSARRRIFLGEGREA
jgi:hypothetical protein